MPIANMNLRDLEIRVVESGKYAGSEVVGIRPSVAFDENFVTEMRALGVRDAVKFKKDEEE